MGTITRRVEVCQCENCGNEGEMTVVCELLPLEEAPTPEAPKPPKREKRSFTCVNCGNEADMIVDF